MRIGLGSDRPGRFRLSRHSESQVRNPRACNDTHHLQLGSFITKVLEQPYAAAKERRHEVDLDLVEEPGAKAFLRDARPHHTHVLVTRCCLGLFDCALYAVCDERVRRLAFWDFLRHVVGHDEDRELGYWSIPSPPIREVVGPPTGNDRSDAVDEILEYSSIAGRKRERRPRIAAPAGGLLILANRRVAIEIPVEQAH